MNGEFSGTKLDTITSETDAPTNESLDSLSHHVAGTDSRNNHDLRPPSNILLSHRDNETANSLAAPTN